MRDVIGWVGAAEESVVLTTGLLNAGYFARRAGGNGEGRWLAAALLAALYAGTAALALALLVESLEVGVARVALRAPLVVANVVTCALIVIGARR